MRCHGKPVNNMVAVNVVLLLLVVRLKAVGAVGKDSSLFCPEGCLCPREEEVLCDGVVMAEIPQEMSPNLRNLSISRGRIEQIGADDFRFYKNLERLSLSYCELMRVEEYTFTGLPRLKYLTLLHNPLSEVGAYAFAGMKDMKEVIVRADGLHRISAFTFYDSSSIRVLDLRSSSVRVIETDAFNGLANVQFLHLPMNLHTVEPGAFRNLSRVHFVDIRQWQTNESGVVRDTFSGLSHVSGIRVDQSNLGTVHSGAFDNLETVETVQIRNSRISSIRSDAFAGMRNVGKLELLNNEIAHVARHAFSNVPGDNVYALAMIDNDLDCSCRNGWLVFNYAQLDNVTLRKNYCSAPKQLAQRALRGLGTEYITECLLTYEYHYLDAQSCARMAAASVSNMAMIALVVFFALPP